MVSMAIPKATEYAIKILICLALSGGDPVPAAKVAHCVGISPSQAAKILHFLRWARLARSRRGPSGGYSLRQRPEEIHVEQVMQLFQLTPEEKGDTQADPLERIWSEAFARSQHDWGQLSIAELAQRTAGHWQCCTPIKNRDTVPHT